MERDLVRERRWVTAEDFRRGVALACLCPGPVGTQTGVYMGWRRAGFQGSRAALVGFLLPAFVLIGLLAEAQRRWGGGGALAAAAAGARCAVIPVIAISSVRLFRSVLRSRVERALAVAGAALCVAAPEHAVAAVIAAGAALAAAGAAKERVRPRGAAAVGLLPVFLVGLQAGALVYGTGQAILPVVRQTVVLGRGWLTEAQFADAVSAGLVTPGPIVLALAYVGHLVAGWPGALAAAAGAFLPAWALVLLVGPWMERLERYPALAGFARGATAGAIGGVAAAALGLAGAAYVTPSAAVLGAVSAAAVASGRVPDAATIACAALLGAALR